MNTIRWNRLFSADNRSLIVALDHISSGFMTGWEYPETTLEKILRAGPDAIMANFGILKRFSSLVSGNAGTILRLDAGYTYLLEEWPDCSRWEAFYSVEDAINLGMDGVIVTILVGSRVELESMRIAAHVAGECLRHNLPYAIEALPVKGLAISDQLDPLMVSFSARLASELGADFVKTYYTGTPESFKIVTDRCPVPVLTAGGPKLDDDRQLLEMVKGVLDGGGQGIFIGRNAWQHKDPTAILKALKVIIHQQATVEESLQELT